MLYWCFSFHFMEFYHSSSIKLKYHPIKLKYHPLQLLQNPIRSLELWDHLLNWELCNVCWGRCEHPFVWVRALWSLGSVNSIVSLSTTSSWAPFSLLIAGNIHSQSVPCMHLGDSEDDSYMVQRLFLKSTDCPGISVQKKWKKRETVERNKEIVHCMSEGDLWRCFLWIEITTQKSSQTPTM